MKFFDSIGDAAKSVFRGVKGAAETVVHGATKAVGWIGDLFTGNLGAQAMPIPEILRQVEQGKGTNGWHQGAEKAAELAHLHRDIGDEIVGLKGTLESVWTGSGADAAQARLKPLVDVTNVAAQTFTSNSSNVTNVAYEFDHMKRAMAEDKLPPTPPHKNFFDVANPFTTDTEAKINAYNAAIERNLARYKTYAQRAGTNGQQLTNDYGRLGEFGDGEITIVGPNTPPKPGKRLPREPVPRGDIEDLETTGKDDSGRLEDRVTRPENDARGDRDPTSAEDRRHPGRTPGETRAAGYAPASGGGSAYPPGAIGGFGTTGGHPGSEERAFGSGASRVGAGGWGAGGTGRGAGQSRPAGRPGVPGAAGMGGMGAGRGQGEEDGEHRRKYGVPDDSAFSEADGDEYLVDPGTGMRVVPPTLGEG